MRSLFRRLAMLGVASTLLVAPGFAGTASAQPSGGADGRHWTADYKANPQYPGMHADRDVRLRMSDGVVLKANVYRPADRSGQPIKTKTPVLVNLTPYSKLIFSMAGEAANNPVLWPLLEQIIASVNLTGTPIASAEQLLGLIKGGGSNWARGASVGDQIDHFTLNANLGEE